MPHSTVGFTYNSAGELCAENVKLSSIAKNIGTPFYCYSTAGLQQAAFAFDRAFQTQDTLICFAVKANNNPAILRISSRLGLGADVVSGGELRLALRAKIQPEKIVFSGVGKTKTELTQALKAGIFQINIESIAELKLLNDVAKEQNTIAKIALRVNPDVDAATHAKITTGTADNKFGIPWAEVIDAYHMAGNLPHIDPVGVAVHIGSQITNLDPFKAAFTKVVQLVKDLRTQGHNIKRLDLGGGLGIRYVEENPAAISDYAQMVIGLTKDLGCKLMFEPGRFIAGPSGILVSSVTYVKETAHKKFAILNAGMNDFMRPAIYDAAHRILPVKITPNAEPTEQYDVVGPVCESSDVFARNRQLPKLAADDLLAIMATGAYGTVLSNNYNMRLSIPEVLVDKERVALIKRRQKFEELDALYQLPTWLVR